MFHVSLGEIAAEELDRAYHWYEEQREGLGDELLGEFLAAVRRATQQPRRFAVVEADMRRAPLHRLPYALFYRVQDEQVVVVALFHGRRDPSKWHGRRRWRTRPGSGRAAVLR